MSIINHDLVCKPPPIDEGCQTVQKPRCLRRYMEKLLLFTIERGRLHCFHKGEQIPCHGISVTPPGGWNAAALKTVMRAHALLLRYPVRDSPTPSSVILYPRELGGMHVFIKQPNEQYLGVEIDPGDAILALKEKISLMTDIAVDRQRLLYRGEELASDRRFDAYEIPPLGTLHLVDYRGEEHPVPLTTSSAPISSVKEASEFLISVWILGGDRFIVHVRPKQTILELKRWIQREKRFPVEFQQVMRWNVLLKDEQTFESLEMANHSRFFVRLNFF